MRRAILVLACKFAAGYWPAAADATVSVQAGMLLPVVKADAKSGRRLRANCGQGASHVLSVHRRAAAGSCKGVRGAIVWHNMGRGPVDGRGGSGIGASSAAVGTSESGGCTLDAVGPVRACAGTALRFCLRDNGTFGRGLDGVIRWCVDFYAQAPRVKASRALLQAAPSVACEPGAYTISISPRARRQEIRYVSCGRSTRRVWHARSGWGEAQDRTLYCITKRYERPTGKFLHRELLAEHRCSLRCSCTRRRLGTQFYIAIWHGRMRSSFFGCAERARRGREGGRGHHAQHGLSVTERDAMGLVQYPATKLPTFLAAGARRAWIGGSQGGFYAPEEAYFRGWGCAMMESGRQTWGCVEQVLTTPIKMAAVGLLSPHVCCECCGGGSRAVAWRRSGCRNVWQSLFRSVRRFLGALRWAVRNLASAVTCTPSLRQSRTRRGVRYWRAVRSCRLYRSAMLPLRRRATS